MMLSRIAAACHGTLKGEDVRIDSVSINSRTLKPGDMFVAIRGERFDGHDFIVQAREAGASAVLVEHDVAFPHYIEVEDTRKALGMLAKAWSNRDSLRRIAVTGNAGKTTVKEMIALILSDATLLATEGNLNNDIGVPLTLLRVREEHQFGVFELGANHAGEIAWTTSLVEPHVAMITNVTGAHLEGFGSLQGIANAKAEIFSGLREGGQAIINLDDSFADFFSAQARQHTDSLITVSASQQADVYATEVVTGAEGVSFTVHDRVTSCPVSIPMPGRHNVTNALMAIAAALAVDVPLQVAAQKLSSMKPVSGRGVVSHAHWNEHPVALIDDSYNAHPGSVLAAARLLQDFPSPRILVLGGMAELGESGQALLSQLGKDLSTTEIDVLITLDNAAISAATFEREAIVVPNKQAASEAVLNRIGLGGSVLVKGSRSAAMETLAEALRQAFAENTANQPEEPR